MKKMSQSLFSILLVLSLSSIAFCDVTSSITSLVGRNAEGYLAPLGTMMGGGMNSGFYRKASPHKILGFDITLDLVYAMAPTGQTTYNFVIPNDSIGFAFPFKFPKNLLVPESSPMYNYIPHDGLNETLYKDREIDFSLSNKVKLFPSPLSSICCASVYVNRILLLITPFFTSNPVTFNFLSSVIFAVNVNLFF